MVAVNYREPQYVLVSQEPEGLKQGGRVSPPAYCNENLIVRCDQVVIAAETLQTTQKLLSDASPPFGLLFHAIPCLRCSEKNLNTPLTIAIQRCRATCTDTCRRGDGNCGIVRSSSLQYIRCVMDIQP